MVFISGFVSGKVTDTAAGNILLSIYVTSGGMFFGQNIMFFRYQNGNDQRKFHMRIAGGIYFFIWVGLALGAFGYLLSLIV